MKDNTLVLEPYEILRYAILFPRSQIPLAIKASVIPAISYLIFLSLASLTGKFFVILNSPMHLIQISFSFCIYLGIVSADVMNTRFNSTFRQSRYYFKVNDTEYREFLLRLTDKINGCRGLIFSLPLMICSTTYFIMGVFPNIPNEIFPVSATSPVLIYVTIIEFSIGMLFLLGNVGFGFAIVLPRHLGNSRPSPYRYQPYLPIDFFTNYPI